MFVGMHYINGEFYKHRSDFASFNPSNEQPIGWFPCDSCYLNIENAVDSAKKAFKKWRLESRIKRAEYFDKLAQLIKERQDSLANAISLETGKSLNESNAEVLEALHMVQFTFGKGREVCGKIIASEIADKDSITFRKPKGVVAVITAFNFPFALCLWNAAPAILEGNTVIFKPSEETPIVGQLIARLFDESGFPPGVFNLIHGGSFEGEALVKADVNHVSFTGSYSTGKIIKIICAHYDHKSCSCEMGSKSAVIVFDDANMNLALNACLTSAFKLSGQRCVSASRILVQRNKLSEFTERFTEMASAIKIGDPFDESDSMMGPIINEFQMKKVLDYNKMTENDRNVKILLKGFRLKRPGWFLTPHVYMCQSGLDTKARFFQEEVFGPHVGIIPFDTVDEAIEIYNNTKYGLALAVCTSDYIKMRRIRNECDFGMGYVNSACIGSESQQNFTGWKCSGFGGGSAAASFETMSENVAWTVNHNENNFKMAQGLNNF